ncbi:VOC family protein [Tersicoccus sp. Bi-70]|uniref:VOC family protein n=1 Tax=Tersicoccus sp. Bi-70 TaxID=1897634 RepID=UPI0009781E8E|nr:VOC family protein [Tersicoccus sp. Bi-70]OMH32986.1 glyoxalase [Tersicoccus sp. Bi-70]
MNPLHHVELWTDDLTAAEPSFGWLLPALGFAADHDPDWPRGRIWRHESGVYLVLEQSPDVTGPHDRLRAGLNHLAFRIADRPALDALRREAGEHGWHELFADRYPHAGGPDHTALFLENGQGVEVEIVAEGPDSG